MTWPTYFFSSLHDQGHRLRTCIFTNLKIFENSRILNLVVTISRTTIKGEVTEGTGKTGGGRGVRSATDCMGGFVHRLLYNVK